MSIARERESLGDMREATCGGVNLKFHKIEGWGDARDGAQKHREVERRREGREVPLALCFALLLTRAGG